MSPILVKGVRGLSEKIEWGRVVKGSGVSGKIKWGLRTGCNLQKEANRGPQVRESRARPVMSIFHKSKECQLLDSIMSCKISL
jgi:hypothetical protein